MNDIEATAVPSLDSLIREALIASPDPDPSSVIDQVIGSIPAENRVEYLRQAIVGRISTVVGQLRAGSTPVPVRRGVSTKQALIRDEYWPAFLQQRIYLADGYKFLADATAADLRAVATQRLQEAHDLTTKAGQFDALAAVMERSRVKTLGALDPAVGRSVMERAA